MPGLLLTSSSDVCWVGVVWTRVPGQLSAVTCPVPSIPPSPDTGRPPRVSTPHLRIYISMLDIYYQQPTFISIYLLSMLDIYYLHPTSISIYLCWISTLHLHINAGYLHCTSVSMIDIYYLHRTCISMYAGHLLSTLYLYIYAGYLISTFNTAFPYLYIYAGYLLSTLHPHIYAVL